MALVAFAGDERCPGRALALFRSGMDTFDIARKLGISEARASKLIHEERSREKGLPVQWERHLPRYRVDDCGHRISERSE